MNMDVKNTAKAWVTPAVGDYVKYGERGTYELCGVYAGTINGLAVVLSESGDEIAFQPVSTLTVLYRAFYEMVVKVPIPASMRKIP